MRANRTVAGAGLVRDCEQWFPTVGGAVVQSHRYQGPGVLQQVQVVQRPTGGLACQNL